MQKLILFIVLFMTYSASSCSAQKSLGENPADQNKHSIDRQKDIQTILHITENYICNPLWLNTPEWKTFTDELQSSEMQRLNFEEFVQTFNRMKNDLPFSHFYLTPTKRNSTKNENKPAPFELSELNNQTVLLTIRSFVSDAPAMIEIVKQIAAGKYPNLIIDLRNNTGGTLDAAVVLGRFLTNEAIDAGAYLSRKWFLENGRYPLKEEIENFPVLQDMSFDGFGKMLNQHGIFRMILPSHSNPVYQGKVFVLTNGITGSTCEPLVDRLKRTKRAVIVGEKTAGGMLSGRYFTINSDLKMFLPVADYITAEGTRIDKIGIHPNIEVRSANALNYVLKELL